VEVTSPQKDGCFCGIHALPQRLRVTFEEVQLQLAYCQQQTTRSAPLPARPMNMLLEGRNSLTRELAADVLCLA
jgi:hypothetical protein